MPFVTLAKITPLIPAGIVVALGRNDGANFTAIEGEAAVEIRDLSGVAIPADVDDSPDWIILPAARIIAKLALRLVSDWSPETIQSIEKDYLTAREDLRSRRSSDPDLITSRSVVDTFEGEENF